MADDEYDYTWWVAPLLLALVLVGILVVGWRVFAACPASPPSLDALAPDLRAILVDTPPRRWDAAVAELAARSNVDAGCLRRAFKEFVTAHTPGVC